MGTKALPLNFLLVGEAPAADGSRGNLDVTLAWRAAHRAGVPPVGTVAWLEEHHQGLHSFVVQTTHVNLSEACQQADRNVQEVIRTLEQIEKHDRLAAEAGVGYTQLRSALDTYYERTRQALERLPGLTH